MHAYAARYTLILKLKGAHRWGGVPAGIRLPPRRPPHFWTCLESGSWSSRSQFSGLIAMCRTALALNCLRCENGRLAWRSLALQDARAGGVAWLGLERKHAFDIDGYAKMISHQIRVKARANCPSMHTIIEQSRA
jgi:hypothetical protein